jgi:murein DD-endopeptidase MepM/ murein hydrolase activator NlpD
VGMFGSLRRGRSLGPGNSAMLPAAFAAPAATSHGPMPPPADLPINVTTPLPNMGYDPEVFDPRYAPPLLDYEISALQGGKSRPGVAPANSIGLSPIACPVAAPALVKSPFGARKAPKKGASTAHNGIDFRNPLGSSVFATQDGIAHVFRTPRGGNSIAVRNDDGSRSGYAHSRATVADGSSVHAGQAIGVSDGSGNSTGPHLHYTYTPPHSLSMTDPMALLEQYCRRR